MIDAIIATGFIFLLMVFSELLWRHRLVRGEASRKNFHILAGIFVAFLPFWVGYGWVAWLAVSALISGVVNRRIKIFRSGSDIKRKTFGDLLFGLSILICAILKPNKWLFAGAILQVALADGFAAVVGTRYARRRYEVFGSTKSIIGTTTFFVISLLITTSVLHFGGLDIHASRLAGIVIVSAALATVENFGIYGTDNLTLPISFLLLLKLLNV